MPAVTRSRSNVKPYSSKATSSGSKVTNGNGKAKGKKAKKCAQEEVKNVALPTSHFVWEGIRWCRLVGEQLTTHCTLQNAWVKVYPALCASVGSGMSDDEDESHRGGEELEVAKGRFRGLLSAGQILDFLSVLVFELHPIACKGVCMDIGAMSYLRVWTVKHCRDAVDAPVVRVDVDTLVLLGQSPTANIPRFQRLREGKTNRSELAIVLQPRRIPRVVLHLGNDMAPKSAYGFLKEVETLVLVIADLAAVDPDLLANVLALNLIPAAWWNDNGDWYPIERGCMRGCAPRLIVVGNGPISDNQARGLSKTFGIDKTSTLAEYITGLGDETYGLKELGIRCSMLSFEEYKDSIGEEAYWIEMGEMGAP
ncbi:hypothetical protein CspHIS471_0108790 [Cutaneotrichosporon sp. HIS471]|nr:hypothetical protein CspHIS471_0108790 [Cutaneotrichosporon sp. HIS471]